MGAEGGVCWGRDIIPVSILAFRTLVQLDTNSYDGEEGGFLGQICLGKDWLFFAVDFSVFLL